MTYPPGQEINVRSDGAGLAQSATSLPLVVGYGSLLTPNTLYQSSNPNSFRDLCGSGPVLETALAGIAKAGAVMVLALAASVAGVVSSVTAERVDSSAGTVAVSGTPKLDFAAAVEVTKTGAKGVGRFKYTLDGLTYTAERVIPLGGTFLMPGSDLTLTFAGTNNNSDVEQSGAGPAVSLTGVGGNDSAYVLTITTGGANGTAVFSLTRNGVSVATGVTVPTTPFTYAVSGTTNLVITFANGTYVLNETYTFSTATSEEGDFELGDVHSFTTTAPHYSTADLAAGMAVLGAQLGTRKVRRVMFTGRNASAAAGATMAAAVASHLATLEGQDYFARGLLDTGATTADSFRSAFTAFANDRVAVSFRRARCTVRAFLDGYTDAWQSGVRAVAERIFESDLSENLGRKASGPMEWVTAVDHDEGADTQFAESDKVLTFRSYRGEAGFYVTNGFLRSPAGSDFVYWDWGCTIDELCEAVVEGQEKWLLSKLRALTDGSGNMSPNDVARIRNAVQSLISQRLKDPQNVEGFNGHVVEASYAIESNDFLGTRIVQSTAAAIPLPPVEGFTTTIGLTRSI